MKCVVALREFALSIGLVVALASSGCALTARQAAGAVASQSVTQGLVAFNSDEGLARLVRSAAKIDFPALANQFEPQSNTALWPNDRSHCPECHSGPSH